MTTWPRSTDFDTFPAAAAGLPVGTKVTLENSIFSDFLLDSLTKYLVIDDAHQHSGSVAVTPFGDDVFVKPWLASNAGPVTASAEDFHYWLYYQHPDRLPFGAGGTSEPWLSAYALYTGTVGAARDNWDWEILLVYVRRLTDNLEWRVVFYDASEALFLGPLSTWTKIQVQTTLAGLVTVTLSTDAATLGSFESAPGLLADIGQHFAVHELHMRKEPVYGQMWIDDINYSTPAPVITGRPDLSRRRFT